MNDQLLKSQDSIQHVMDMYGQLGFQKKYIWEAWKNTNHRQSQMLDELIKITTDTGQISQIQPLGLKQSISREDSKILEAINLSLKTQQSRNNTEDFIRKENTPVGLVNLGRTCYFNVVIQTLFNIKEIRDLILNIKFDKELKEEQKNNNQFENDANNQQEEEKQKLINMTKQYQILFACLLKGKKSLQNPKDLFESLRDLNGECFKIGEENDFWEFQNSTFELLEKLFANLNSLTNQELKSPQSSLFLSKLIPSSIQSDLLDSNQESQKKSEIQQKDQYYNPMTELFYGKIQECISYKEGQNIQNKYKEYVQGIVSLEVKHGDLYKALEASQVFEISDYEMSNGVKTKVKVENKFKKAPQILNININRLDFDRDKLCTVKLNKQFYFEKELNLDIFCINDDSKQSNLTKDDQLSLEKLNRQIKKVEKKLKECQNPNSAPIQLESCFQSVIQFLQKQQCNIDDFIDIDEYEMDLEKADGQFGLLGTKQEVQTTLNILQKYKEQIEKQAESLTQKLEKLRKERWQLYKKSKRNFYELFSILMHEGSADSGHYYCYIWDENADKWYKYNDSIVTEVVEDDVLYEAYGKPDSTKNACCLFYRNKCHKVDYTKISDISQHLQEEVNKKDKQFFDDIDKQKVLNSLEPFKGRLAQEIAKRQSLIQCNQDSLQCINELINFENFLLNIEQFKHYGIRQILINILKESDQSLIESQLRDPANLDEGIELFFQQLEKKYRILPYKNIKDSQLAELKVLKETHQTLLKLMKEFEAILKNFEKIDQYSTVIKSLCAIQQTIKDSNPYIVQNSLFGLRLNQATNYMLQVQLLKGCFNIECSLHKQNSKDLMATTNIMVLALMAFYSNQELFKQQIEQNLKYTLNTHGSNPNLFTPQILKEFQTSIEKIPKLNQLYENNVHNLRETFALKYQSIQINWDSQEQKLNIAASLLQSWDKQLGQLNQWRQFLDKLLSEKKLVSQNDRLDKEELLYTQYL